MIKLPSQFTTIPHCLCKLSHVPDTEEHKKIRDVLKSIFKNKVSKLKKNFRDFKSKLESDKILSV